MRLSTLGRAAGGTAVVLFVAASVADAYGAGLLRLALLITSGVLAAPVAFYLLLFLPARPAAPTASTRTALPAAVPARALPSPPPARPTTIGALPAAQPMAALPAAPASPRRRPSPRPRRDERPMLTR